MFTLIRVAAAGVSALVLFVAICIAVSCHAPPLVVASFTFAGVLAVLANLFNFLNPDHF